MRGHEMLFKYDGTHGGGPPTPTHLESGVDKPHAKPRRRRKKNDELDKEIERIKKVIKGLEKSQIVTEKTMRHQFTI